MKIEIWSDVMCPFCYIGKRKFENALARFAHKDEVKIEWKSFQLDPDLKNQSGKSVNEYLAERKGLTLDEARRLHDRVTRMAKDAGLVYDFDKAVVANSFDAHRLVHLAKNQGLDGAMEEKLFQAYFTQGKNIADASTLIKLGTEIGLDETEIKNLLRGAAFSQAVHDDIEEAHRIGVTGVPFFVLDRKYAVSGAQDSGVFQQVLEKSFAEWINP